MTARASGGHSEQWCGGQWAASTLGSGRAAQKQPQASSEQEEGQRRDTSRPLCSARNSARAIARRNGTGRRVHELPLVEGHVQVHVEAHAMEQSLRAESHAGTSDARGQLHRNDGRWGSAHEWRAAGSRPVVEGSEQASSGHRAGSGKAAAGRQRAGGGSADDTLGRHSSRERPVQQTYFTSHTNGNGHFLQKMPEIRKPPSYHHQEYPLVNICSYQKATSLFTILLYLKKVHFPPLPSFLFSCTYFSGF